MTNQFKTKRDKILFYYDKYLKDHNDQDKATQQVKDALDEGNGYINDVVEKNRREDLEPRTEKQRVVVQIYNEHPDWTHTKIAKETEKRFGEKPSLSAVSDYIQKFCNEKRSNPDSYDISNEFMDAMQNKNKDSSKGTLDRIQEERESDVQEEKSKTSESLNDLDNDEIFTIIRCLINSGEDDLAQTLMKFHE